MTRGFRLPPEVPRTPTLTFRLKAEATRALVSKETRGFRLQAEVFPKTRGFRLQAEVFPKTRGFRLQAEEAGAVLLPKGRSYEPGSGYAFGCALR
jgi:hypothetical protein